MHSLLACLYQQQQQHGLVHHLTPLLPLLSLLFPTSYWPTKPLPYLTPQLFPFPLFQHHSCFYQKHFCGPDAMEMESIQNSKDHVASQSSNKQLERPHSIIFTSPVNIISFQQFIKLTARDQFHCGTFI